MLPSNLDLIHMILNAGLVVQLVLLTLLFFSVSSWAIMIMKYRYLRRAFEESARFSDFFWKSTDLTEAFNRAKLLAGSPVARVFRVGYVELRRVQQQGVGPDGQRKPGNPFSRGGDNVRRALRRAINSEVARMSQMVPFLATTGNTTPFIGLFGTVWGIMNSFHGIGLRGSASLAVVAPGISEALVATAAGLAAAIPAVIAYNYFTQKIRLIETELYNFASDFQNILERDILGREEAGR
ncbi:MAG: protein TolQ [Desulfobacteraceae bacterium]|nr:protein TolQ [Desulfobacteraceae bacterium]